MYTYISYPDLAFYDLHRRFRTAGFDPPHRFEFQAQDITPFFTITGDRGGQGVDGPVPAKTLLLFRLRVARKLDHLVFGKLSPVAQKGR